MRASNPDAQPEIAAPARGRGLRIALIVGLVLFVGLAGYLWYVNRQLGRELAETRDQLEKMTQRAELLQQRGKEQQSRISWLEQAKRTADAQIGALQQAATTLEADKQKLIAEKLALEEQLKGRLTELAQVCEDKLKAQGERNAELLKVIEQARDAIATQRAEIGKLTGEKGDLTFKLTTMTDNFTRCTDNNTRLSGISGELLDKWWNKGMGDVLAQREPFTQVRKVEMERLMQEYNGKIRDNTLKQ